MLKILHVGTFPYPSTQGSQVYVRSLLKGLVALGHQVSLLCYAHGDEDVVWNDPDIEIHRIQQISDYENLRAGPDLMKPILDALLSIKMMKLQPDIIHVHNYEAPLVSAIGRYHRKIPMVYSAHNTMCEELPTYFSLSFSKKVARCIGKILDYTVPRIAEATIVIRSDSVQKLRNLGCRNVSCIEPSISLNEFQFSPIVLPKGKWIVYAGNPDNYQDLDVLISAMHLLDSDIRLILIGGSSFERWTTSISERVLCIQTSRFSEVLSYIDAAEIAVLPRSVCSGFPIKILNYLAVGTPVVVAEGSDIGLDGCVSFPNGDSRAMAEMISSLLQNDEEMKRLANIGKTQVLTKYTWESAAKKLEKVYLSLLHDIEK
jgi:glycosyltransferase involved in cell wall biosynthesis